MTPARARELLEVFTAFANGETIQSDDYCESFTDDLSPSFNDCVRYRLKPKPRLRPWTKDECPKIFIARPKHGGEPVIMRPCPQTYASIAWYFESQDERCVMPESLLAGYVRIDEHGNEHPCGAICGEGE